MSNARMIGTVPPPRERRADAHEFRLIYLASFAFYLVAAVASRLAPWGWAAAQNRRAGRSVFGEAKAAAYASIPLAFMG